MRPRCPWAPGATTPSPRLTAQPFHSLLRASNTWALRTPQLTAGGGQDHGCHPDSTETCLETRQTRLPFSPRCAQARLWNDREEQQVLPASLPLRATEDRLASARALHPPSKIQVLP